MSSVDIESLILAIDELIFSRTGKHLDDLQHKILRGSLNHQKYSEIAKQNRRSQKYVKDLGSKLWQTISEVLEEDVGKSNIKSTLQRYYYSNSSDYHKVKDIIKRGNIPANLPENDFTPSKIYQQAKLETVTELIKEGLSVEQIAKVLKLPLEVVHKEIQNSE